MSSQVSRYRAIRRTTERLCEPLTPEDCVVQSMPDASPAKWHLAHTCWFFETFILEREFADYYPFQAEFREMFNSYYNSVGEQFARPQRGMLTRPTLKDVMGYREHVDGLLLQLLEKAFERVTAMAEIGLNHEQQHQELIVMDVKHLLSLNPLKPIYRVAGEQPPSSVGTLAWRAYEGGVVEQGHAGEGFAFDNERPRHRVLLQPFELATRLVTNGEFLEFIEDGGYESPELWLSDGWATAQAEGWQAPLYWRKQRGAWQVFTLSGERAVHPDEPVCHVSFYEAEAFARWSCARLPREAEWEHAAAALPIRGQFLEGEAFHPVPLSEENSDGPAQMFGDVWEWTQSAYAAYPGYQPPDGALGEYNGKFMSNQLVLRGGSCATPHSHIRASYRNFFYPHQRWQFAGIRLARDAS